MPLQKDRHGPPDPKPVFVASYPGPIYCEAPPGTETTESSAGLTTSTQKSSISIAHNSGHIIICDAVNILPDNTPECKLKRKPTDSILIDDSTKTLDQSLNNDEMPTPKRAKINRDLIEQHILSYNLMINKDKVRYLPRRLTKEIMYKDFISKNPTLKCGISSYGQKLRDLKVSRRDHKIDNCTICHIAEKIKKHQEEHKTLAESAIKQCKLDSLINKIEGINYYSIALQEIILLPEIPNSQEVFHVSRLVCYNMTFVPINRVKNPCFCMMWHEAMAGGNHNNIVDAIVSFIVTCKNVVHLNFWADDSTRYRNWTLYTAFSILVNSMNWQIQTITMKYLKKGHSDMPGTTADLMHKSIEQNMKREEAIYDFNHLKSIVANSKKNLKVVEVSQFREWLNKSNDSMDNLLSSIIEVKFVRGSRGLLYRTNFQDSMTEINFLVEDFNVNTFSPTLIDNPRGIKPEKKDNIISKLVPSMPEKHKSFWMKLPVNENSHDLFLDDRNTE